MKTTKKFVLAAAMLMAVSLESSAQGFENFYVRATVFPANSGTVFVDDYQLPETYNYGATSEFKWSMQFRHGYIWVKAAEGYQFAGVVRDKNMNGQYDADGDQQLWVRMNHYFDPIGDGKNYEVAGNTKASEELAKQALEAMTTPTDYILAVFTKGAVAKKNPEQESIGRIYSSKLDNAVGDQVTFYAYGDGESQYIDGEGYVYYKFDHWADATGQSVSTNREFTFTVQGGEVYYAHFAVTTKEDYQKNEQVPEQFKETFNNTQWDGGFDGIETVKVAKTANSAIYNINGQRVAQPAKGLFIQNGKKFVVK